MAWSIFVGMVLSVVFYGLLHAGVLGSGLVRYLAGHWIEYTEMTLFLVGLSAIALRGVGLLRQWGMVSRISLATPADGGHDHEHAGRLLQSLEKLPAAARDTYLVQRWTDALQQVSRKNSAEGLDDELKYLADMDAARMHEGYSLVRIIIWATPMLGFLGTVMGITIALGELSPEALVNNPKEAMEGLLAGLSIAFDTTSVALTLSIAMMFAQFLAIQAETNLLAWVDRRTNEELVGRFRQLGSSRDPAVSAVQRMSMSMVEACGQLVEKQAQIWAQSQSELQSQMAQWWQQARSELSSSTHRELHASVVTYADGLRGSDESRRAEIQAWQDQLQQLTAVGADRFESQQELMERQITQFAQLAAKTEDVLRLEEVLRLNLGTLAESHQFEEMVMSLSAAIHLLNARLGSTSEVLPARKVGVERAA
ncbi:MAG: MotA/TolQ/ExbB proton channel family protein [Planctomycetota bacterium]|nr:MotA/TolQ/ExbB proton channel family protein [Planctomycetota bacterium]MDA1179169.1 MotA/TolQ/ExbB proton channel family protein [Planctomycetota bacterium]